MTPQCLVAYAPRGAGLLAAVVYAVKGNDVYGWWAGYAEGEYLTAFFMLEDFFARYENAFFTTAGGDLYGGFTRNYDAEQPQLEKPVAIDDAMAHELERMQYVFGREWLSFPGDEDAEEEAARYRDAELAMQPVNVRFKRLDKLRKDQPVWVYRSPGLDVNIIERLMRDWPLDFRGALEDR